MWVEFNCLNCKVAVGRDDRHWDRGLPKFCSRECHDAYRKKPSVIKKRFWSKVDVRGKDECWLWKGRTSKGYGMFQYNRVVGKQVQLYASRFAYIITRGSAKGFHVCHTCDVPACCNPEHLFLGTMAENIADRDKKGRQARGHRQWKAKLTEANVRRIRKLLARNIPQVYIAERFGVTEGTISQIKNNRIWSHV